MKTFHKLLLVTITATALFISLTPANTSSPVMIAAEEENTNYNDDDMDLLKGKTITPITVF